MIEPLDEEILERFDRGEASDHEIKIMLISKIADIIEYCNSIGEWRTRIANKTTELLPQVEKLLEKNTLSHKGNGGK